jgi:hypothetical protein
MLYGGVCGDDLVVVGCCWGQAGEGHGVGVGAGCGVGDGARGALLEVQ